MSQAFKGMSGCLKQAVIDCGLEGKMNTEKTTIYNDKQTAIKYQRRFNWEFAIKQGEKLTAAEWEAWRKRVAELLLEHRLIVLDGDEGALNIGRTILLYCRNDDTLKVDELKVQAEKLGYRLVKA